MKQIIAAIIAIFISWSLIDMAVYTILLKETYAATASLWRPMAEMKMTMMYIVTFAYAACFVIIYKAFVIPKSVTTAIKFGFLFGLATGISMGFGSYSFMPIPLSLAMSWFAWTLIEAIVAGAIAGAIIKPEHQTS